MKSPQLVIIDGVLTSLDNLINPNA